MSDTPGHGASPDGLPPLREVIRAGQLTADKRLGQNFILDFNVTRRIARTAGPLAGHTVIEIGPGPGGLTRALFLEGAERVVVIERDARVRTALDEIGARYPGRLDIHFADALRLNLKDIASGHTNPELRASPLPDQSGGTSPLKPVIVANLPYNIATLLLIGWLETEPWPPWWDRMVLMFQREVAERIVAEPGSKAYGRLAVIAQWRTEARLAFRLPPEAFTPPPKVASAVVEFRARPHPSPECNVTTLGRVTGAAFGQRRKMLRQSLKTLTPMPELLLARVGIDPTRRGETLQVEDFARLAAAYDGMADDRG